MTKIKNLTVVVAGVAGSGKSTMMLLLEDFFKSKGIPATVEDAEEGSLENLRRHFSVDTVDLSEASVLVKEAQLNRLGKVCPVISFLPTPDCSGTTEEM